ncbi:MAG: hypothetical protein QNJ51_01035 [Calothrix sp. MO_167.B12]|nr:hypothetical protein [Calothrix sp. MO_167.B12]
MANQNTLINNGKNPMSKSSLYSDDLPIYQISIHDELLLRQLEESVGKKFFQACDHISRNLLTSCHWYFSTNTGVLTLEIICHNRESYWLVHNALFQLGMTLTKFTNKGKINIHPPKGEGKPWSMKVNTSVDKTD